MTVNLVCMYNTRLQEWAGGIRIAVSTSGFEDSSNRSIRRLRQLVTRRQVRLEVVREEALVGHNR